MIRPCFLNSDLNRDFFLKSFIHNHVSSKGRLFSTFWAQRTRSHRVGDSRASWEGVRARVKHRLDRNPSSELLHFPLCHKYIHFTNMWNTNKSELTGVLLRIRPLREPKLAPRVICKYANGVKLESQSFCE